MSARHSGVGTSRRLEPSELSVLLEPHREATFTDANGYHEVLVVPDPDDARYLVLVRAGDGALHHVATFDTDRLAGSDPRD